MTDPILNRAHLSPLLKQQLATIEPSGDDSIRYFPCDVVLRDRSTIDRVVLVSARSYIKIWGIYPELDHGKRAIDLHEVVSVADSSSRLPAEFANKVYSFGESGMGYVRFLVLFMSGFKQQCLTGNLCDFISYPDGLSKEHVKDVMPYTGPSNAPYIEGPEYAWCLFSE